jgi:predicted  nucleic acid-binding Zn-ribbon protein
MANPVPAGSDVSSGTYQCTNCGKQIQMGSQTHIPPCPQCGDGEWETVSGSDSATYPDRDSA